jgi:hypothetical protein
MEKIHYYINETKNPGVTLSVATGSTALKTGATLSYSQFRMKDDKVDEPITILLSQAMMASLCEHLIVSLYGYKAAEEFEKITLK